MRSVANVERWISEAALLAHPSHEEPGLQTANVQRRLQGQTDRDCMRVPSANSRRRTLMDLLLSTRANRMSWQIEENRASRDHDGPSTISATKSTAAGAATRSASQGEIILDGECRPKHLELLPPTYP